MNFIEPSVTVYDESDLEKKVEHCYRICYMSEDKMTGTGDFLEKMTNNNKEIKHYSPLEHARIRLLILPNSRLHNTLKVALKYLNLEQYCKYGREESGEYYYYNISFRTLKEVLDFYTNELMDENAADIYSEDIAISVHCLSMSLYCAYPATFKPLDLKPVLRKFYRNLDDALFNEYYSGIMDRISNIKLDDDTDENWSYPLTEATDYITFHITTSRDVLQQIARHRTLSLSVESTKFINYAKRDFSYCIPRPYNWANEFDWTDNETIDRILSACKMSNEVLYHKDETKLGLLQIPVGVDDYIANNNSPIELFLKTAYMSELMYRVASSNGMSAQQARMFLPGMLKTEMYVSGTISAWKHFIQLRSDSTANPQIQFIANKIKDLLKERNLI